MSKPNQSEIKETVFNYIIEEYLEDMADEIDYDTPLISSGHIDSFSMVTLLVFIENKFGIKIPPSKATPEAFNTVNNITGLINEYL